MINWYAVCAAHGIAAQDPLAYLANAVVQYKAAGSPITEVTQSAKTPDFFASIRLSCPQTLEHVRLANECAVRLAWDSVTTQSKLAGCRDLPPPLPEGAPLL